MKEKTRVKMEIRGQGALETIVDRELVQGLEALNRKAEEAPEPSSGGSTEAEFEVDVDSALNRLFEGKESLP